MAWIMVGTTVGGLALGALQGDQKRKDQQKYNEGQAEITRYSPWTGMRGQVAPNTDSALSGGITGAVSGLNFGAGIARNAKPAAESNMDPAQAMPDSLNFGPPTMAKMNNAVPMPESENFGPPLMAKMNAAPGAPVSMYEQMSPGQRLSRNGSSGGW